MINRTVQIVAALCIVLLAWFLIPHLVSLMCAGIGQSDFAVYYYAGKAWAHGLSPYDNANLSRLAGHPIYLTYAYIPVLLPFFTLFTYTSFQTACAIWMAVKLVLFAFLVWLWCTRIITVPSDRLIFVLFAVFAWRSGALLDFYTGNKSVFEETLLWIGLFYFLTQRYRQFCVCIVLTALFNVTPVLLLALLFGVDCKPRIKYMVASLASLALLIAVPFLFSPEYLAPYRSNASTAMLEFGRFDVGIFALFQDLTFRLPVSHNMSTNLASAAYLIFVGLVLSISFKRVQALAADQDKRPLLFFSLLIYALVLPRLKDYTLILLTPSAYYFIQQTWSRNRLAGWCLFLLTILPITDVWAGARADIVPLAYWPLWLVGMYWGLYNFVKPAEQPHAALTAAS